MYRLHRAEGGQPVPFPCFHPFRRWCTNLEGGVFVKALSPEQHETIAQTQRALIAIAECRRTINTLIAQQDLPVRPLLLAEVGMAWTDLQAVLLADEIARRTAGELAVA